jgi:hypothetical protein
MSPNRPSHSFRRIHIDENAVNQELRAHATEVGLAIWFNFSLNRRVTVSTDVGEA